MSAIAPTAPNGTLPQWTHAERRAWRWPDRLSPSQWAAKYRLMSAAMTAEPGQWNPERAPYLNGIMDAVALSGVEKIVVPKPAQIGGSEAMRNILGYWIDQDPGPCLFVLPSEQACKDYFAERIMPLLEGSPSLSRHLTSRKWDVKTTSIALDCMTIYGGWSGSPTTLASRPIRYVVCDEIDKFPPFSGREADPISLAAERTATYKHRRRILLLSTPTTRDGAIWKAFDAAGDKQHFQVPCPFCGAYQPLVFSQVKWPPELAGQVLDKSRLADLVEADELAWYECASPACRARIPDARKAAMLVRGLWVSQGQTVLPGGVLAGERPRSRSLGMHPQLVSPWRTFSAAAAEFLRAGRDAGRIMNFRNSWLAEPFELQVAKTPASLMRRKCETGPPPGRVPCWARALIATADTQGTSARDGWFPYVVRAWGYEFRSRLVEYGIANSFDELRERCLNRMFPIDDKHHAAPPAAPTGLEPSGQSLAPQMLLIDTGGPRWNEVYQFAQSDRLRVRPTKGASTPLAGMVAKSPQKAHDIILWNIDTEKAKDLLHRLIHDPDDTRWQAASGPPDANGVVTIDEQYCAQMAAEHKIFDRKSGQERWVPVTSGIANHAWDAEVLQCAAAFDLGAGNPEPKAAAQLQPPAPAKPIDPRQRERERFGWLDRRPNLPR